MFFISAIESVEKGFTQIFNIMGIHQIIKRPDRQYIGEIMVWAVNHSLIWEKRCCSLFYKTLREVLHFWFGFLARIFYDLHQILVCAFDSFSMSYISLIS